MYTKNLEQLLRLLQSSKQSGLLIVEKTEQENAFWQGYFRLVNGNVTACMVSRKIDRQVIRKNEEALHWLIAQGKLEWRLEEEGQLSPFQQLLPAPRLPSPEDGIHSNGAQKPATPSPASQAVWTPRRTQKGLMMSAKSLGSLEHLQVFTLVNGQNTVEGIARLLRKPPQQISSILNQMRAAGLIE